MKHTPLYEAHLARRAGIVEFAGWAMPMQYAGVLAEYHAVRAGAGLFDVSHMGRLHVEGPDAVPFLQRVTTGDVRRIAPMRSQYSMICNADGGVKDDVFLSNLDDDRFLVCVNASNLEKIRGWLSRQQTEGREQVRIVDHSEDVAQLALQGPASGALLARHMAPSPDGLKVRQGMRAAVCGEDCLITRTGYTGELGYELYVPAAGVRRVWDHLLKSGEKVGLAPAGLAARDLLRLDMGYFLYGQDLTETVTPIEANAAWTVSFTKGAFVGDAALKRQVERGPSVRLAAFELMNKAVPRHGMNVFASDREIGAVTSGNLSPILQKGIGLACVEAACAAPGTVFEIDIRGRRAPARVVELPFYRRPRGGARRVP